MRSAFVLLIFLAHCASAEIITSDRRVIWSGNVGVSNGIPSSASKTIYTNLTTSVTLSAFQAALNNCPANQVVELATGTFNLTNTLQLDGVNSGVVLRGATNAAGLPTTIVNFTNAGAVCIYVRPAGGFSGLSTDSDLSADALKGTNVLALASVPAWVVAGGLIGIDQLDDTNVVGAAGTEGGSSYRQSEGNGARGMGQLNRVLATTSTTITLEIPTYWTFYTSNTAQIFRPGVSPTTSGTKMGFENINFSATFAQSDCHMFKLECADETYWRNCVISNIAGGSAIWTFMCFRLQVGHCHIKDSALLGAGQGYGTAWYHVTCACLVENTIFEQLHNAMTCNYGSSGNVWAYNYELDGQSDSGQNPSMNTHGVHTMMNLWEGNHCEDKVLADWTHGSSSHCTVHRNTVTGENYLDRKDQRVCISVEYYNRWWNIIGNIAGNGVQDKAYQHSGSSSEGTTASIFKIGGEVNINNDFTPSDAYAYASGSKILVHGNYDTVSAVQVWEASVSDQTLLDSYYLSSKPEWFGFLSWPPYNPSNPTANSRTNIPAGYRYAFGTNPPSYADITGQPSSRRKFRGIRIRQ